MTSLLKVQLRKGKQASLGGGAAEKEFDEGDDFCKKLTYKIQEDPKSVLNRFRNSYYPRIAVTVDMIATGTDVKALEVLLFMRDVKSVNYFEQMKGRGTRTISKDSLQNFHNVKSHHLWLFRNT